MSNRVFEICVAYVHTMALRVLRSAWNGTYSYRDSCSGEEYRPPLSCSQKADQCIFSHLKAARIGWDYAGFWERPRVWNAHRNHLIVPDLQLALSIQAVR